MRILKTWSARVKQFLFWVNLRKTENQHLVQRKGKISRWQNSAFCLSKSRDFEMRKSAKILQVNLFEFED